MISFQRRLCAVTIAPFAALLALFSVVFMPSVAIASSPKQGTAVKTKNPDEEKIYSLIRLSQPRRGEAFAKKAASLMVAEAKAEKLPPLLCAAVAYAESHFSSSEGPCVGIMQVHRPSLREYTRKHQGEFAGLDPDQWDDNIRIGVRELGMHYRKYGNFRGALGRYNGCGPNGGYVSRILRVYSRLKGDTPAEWKASLNRGRELWR